MRYVVYNRMTGAVEPGTFASYARAFNHARSLGSIYAVKEGNNTFAEDLRALCVKHEASLYFGDSTASLWIDGRSIGLLRDTGDGEGQTFEVIADES